MSLLSVSVGSALIVLSAFIGCEPTKEENYYINSLNFWRSAKAAKVPEPTTILLTTVACKKAQQDRGRLRAARKLADECDRDPLPEVLYYQKALAAFPEALAGASELIMPLRQACDRANATMQPFPPSGTPKDRDRLPQARQLAEECDRSLEMLIKNAPP
jgi:hypothetical protein